MIIKTYKVRLYPDFDQKKILDQHFGHKRWFWNFGLFLKVQYYEKTKESLSRYDIQKLLPYLKKNIVERKTLENHIRKINKNIKEYNTKSKKKPRKTIKIKILTDIIIKRLENNPDVRWLADVNSQILISVAMQLENAYQHFFRRIKENQRGEKKGSPNYKNKYTIQSFASSQRNSLEYKVKKYHSYKIYNCNTILNLGLLSIPNVGKIKTRLHRNLEKGKIKTVTISKKINHYFASISIETEGEYPEPKKTRTKKAIIVHPKFYKTPPFLEEKQKLLKSYQRRLSKKQKGSRRYFKVCQRLAKIHDIISKRRKYYLHHLSYDLVKNNKNIIIRKQNIKNLVKKRGKKNPKKTKATRDILNKSYHELTRQIKYKAKMYGVNVIEEKSKT